LFRVYTIIEKTDFLFQRHIAISTLVLTNKMKHRLFLEHVLLQQWCGK